MDKTLINLLVIEDNPADYRLLREMLKDSKNPAYNIIHAEKLEDGMEKLKTGGFDAVMLDLNLPDSIGFEGLTRIVNQGHGVPVIVMTGLADEELGIAAIRNKAADYLVKGKSESGLISRSIRYALERKRAEQELQKERNFIEAVLQTTSGLIIGLDLEGRITITNHAAEKLTGYDFAEVKGRAIWEFMNSTEDSEGIMEIFNSIQEGMRPPELDREDEIVIKDGSKRTIHWMSTILDGEDGKPEIILISGIDITESARSRAIALKFATLFLIVNGNT